MKHWLMLACATALLAVLVPARVAHAGKSDYDALVATHAKINHVPEALVHRVILRESRYQPQLLGRGGAIGLMQIKLATAKGLGYTGDAAGLRDPETNLAYGVKYLAGAYRAAEGNHDLAVRYYASGYYYVAKRKRTEVAETRSSDANKKPDANSETKSPDAKPPEAEKQETENSEVSQPEASHPAPADDVAPTPASDHAPRKKPARTRMAHASHPLVIVPVSLRVAKPR